MTDRKKHIEDLMDSMYSMRKRLFFMGKTEVKHSITPAQWVVVHIIAHHTPCTVKDIASRMNMTSSAATQLIEGLVKNGLLTRAPSKSDRRAVSLSLSKKGEKKMAEIKNQTITRMTEVFKALTDTELDQFVSLHKKVSDHIKETCPKN